MQRLQPAAPGSFAKLAARIKPSLVHLRGKVPVRGGPADWFPTGDPSTGANVGGHLETIQRSLGTGFIISADGSVLTNAHIVSQQTDLIVQLHDGTKVNAKVVGQDVKSDLALIQFTPPAGVKLKPVRLGNSDQIEIGEWVVAMGDPFGMGQTIAAGLISGKARTEHLPPDQQGFWGFLQTSVAINPGNSGGPLCTVQGEVVGVSTSIDQQTSGIGFAVPINLARKLVPMLRREGKVVRAWLGIYGADVTQKQAKAAGLKSTEGALVSSVVPNGPAARAGLRSGDVIINFDKRKVKSSRELPWLASLVGINRVVPIQVWRKKKLYSFYIKTERMPDY